MIFIRVEIWPYGEKELAETLGEARIWNIGGWASDSLGDYGYEIRGKKGHLIKTGSVSDFPRKRLLAWDLLYRVLLHARGDKNK